MTAALSLNQIEEAQEALRRLDEAARTFEIERTEDDATAPTEPRYRLLTAQQLAELPEPEPLVAGVLARDTLAAIVAKYASFKSFVAMDLALCIATGLDWHGHAVVQGNVAYIAVEGVQSLHRRVEAWRILNRLPDVGGVYFLPTAVILNEARDLRDFLAAVEAMPAPPIAIIVDTLARTIKGNESDTEDMNGYLLACTRLRESTGATVILVHHTGWEGTRSRGSSSLPGALDTEITLVRDGDQVTITASKQKDGPEGLIATLEAVPVGKSLALRPVVPTCSELTRNERAALTVVQAADSLTSTEWMELTSLAKGSFHNARNRLLALAYVKVAKKRYAITEAGRQALSTTVNRGTTEVQTTGSAEVQLTHTPLGVSVVPDLVPECWTNVTSDGPASM